VAGLIDRPARDPAARMVRASETGSRVASAWKVTLAAPASAYPGAHRSGLSIMRWQSRGIVVALRRLCTTGKPIVKLGTKCASMTSTCSQSALRTAPASSPSRAKSADRMLGAIIGSRTPSGAPLIRSTR